MNIKRVTLVLGRMAVLVFLYLIILGVPFYVGYKFNAWFWATILAFVLATIGPWAYHFFYQKILDMLIKEQMLSQIAVKELLGAMEGLTDIDSILHVLADKVSGVIRPDFSAIYLVHPDKNNYQLQLAYFNRHHVVLPKEFELNSSLVNSLMEAKKPLLSCQVKGQFIRFSEDSEDDLIVPCFLGESLYAFVVFGEKPRGVPYMQEDLIVFESLAKHIGLVVEKSKLIQERDILARDEHMRRQRAMDHFSASLAHELQNPVFAVKGLAEMIKVKIVEDLNKNIPPQEMEYLKERLGQIVFDTDRILRIIKAIRNFSNRDCGGFSQISVDEVLEDFVAMVGPQFKYDGIDFQLEVLPHLSIFGNRIQIEEILINLALNAIHAVKYNDKDLRQVRLKIYSIGEFVRFEISDNGYGIKKEMLESIFIDFVTTKAATEGSGLGLSQVRKIVELHSGRVWAQSSGQGQGAQFFMELPCRSSGESA
jgi:signal transduction histidine kinase